MLDVRPVLYVNGVFVAALGAAMMVPAAVDLAADNPDWRVFTTAGAVSVFSGVSLVLTNRGAGSGNLTLRQTFVLTTASWLTLAVFGALPFLFSAAPLGVVDSFFEAMSGLTTTGSTVMGGLDAAPPGILLWRAILQWLGGIGIIVMSVAVLPTLGVGGMQLLRTESSEKSEKVLPRAAEIAGVTFAIYLALTLACLVALRVSGMSAFDAVIHAMTTVSTGGYSSHDASIAYFASPTIEWTVTAFMVLGGTTFTAYIQLTRRRRRAVLRMSQVRVYLALLVAGTVALAGWRWLTTDVAAMDALRNAAFTVVSIVTTTGFTDSDYLSWGPFAAAAIFLLTFVGGCTGSTAGGIKVFRLQVLYEAARVQLLHLFNPHRVVVARYDGTRIPDDVYQSVTAFFFLFIATFAAVALGLAALGLDLDTAISAAATALANVGPGLGDVVGPTGNFAPLPDAAKMLLAVAMLLGRLELWTVLVLLVPSFWRG